VNNISSLQRGVAMTTELKFTASGGVIRCNDARINIKGINWFGLETDRFALHGLWSVSFNSVLQFLKDNNFNAVRLPISVECVEKMNSAQPLSVDRNANPDLVDISVEEFIDRIITR
jgi:endoglucanase